MRFFSCLKLRIHKLRIVFNYPTLRRALFFHRILAGVEHKTALNRPISTIVDIGANRGQFSLAAKIFTDANIIAFEPLPIAAGIFRKIFSHDPSVTLFTAAIGNCHERMKLHLSARDDSSSLLEIGDAQSNYFPGTHEIGSIEVDVGTLDDFMTKEDIIRPALLKLDVQGFELQALDGCQNLLENFDYIYCECSFVELYKNQKLAGDVILYLGKLGFRLSGLYNLSNDRNGNCIQADLLFTQFSD